MIREEARGEEEDEKEETNKIAARTVLRPVLLPPRWSDYDQHLSGLSCSLRWQQWMIRSSLSLSLFVSNLSVSLSLSLVSMEVNHTAGVTVKALALHANLIRSF